MADTDSRWKRVNLQAAKLRGRSRRTRLARVLALLFVVVGSLDVVSTNAAQAAGFPEGNPVMRLMQEEFGVWWAAPKMAAHLVLASMILWLPTRKLLAAAGVMTVLYVAMVTHNFSLAI